MSMTRLILIYEGIGEAALRAPGVRSLIAAKTSATASAAGPKATQAVGGKRRARGYVRAPAVDEARDGVLTRALGAGR